MDICRIYADFCMYAVAFLLSFLIFVCELNFAEYMRRPIINEKLPISESNPIKARHYDYDRFTYPWHFHSQYEIIYVKESHGLCFVGDCIEKFSAGDVILFGTNLPHYMRSNDIYGSENVTSRVQGTIIQFEQNFMQYSFDYYPQFLQIKMLLEESKRGIIFPKQDATRVGGVAFRLSFIKWFSPDKRVAGFVAGAGSQSAKKDAGKSALLRKVSYAGEQAD